MASTIDNLSSWPAQVQDSGRLTLKRAFDLGAAFILLVSVMLLGCLIVLVHEYTLDFKRDGWMAMLLPGR